MKLLIIIGLLYIAYRWVKNQLAQSSAGSPESVEEAEDTMVKDPICEIYFPKKEGIPLRLGKEEILFCSEHCRDRYVAAQDKDNDKDQ